MHIGYERDRGKFESKVFVLIDDVSFPEMGTTVGGAGLGGPGSGTHFGHVQCEILTRSRLACKSCLVGS